MPRLSKKQSQSIHRPALVARLHEAIRRKHVAVREVKVRKPVELHFKAEDECAICLEPLTKNNIAITPCGHKFCFSCIAENLNVSKNCPMCRTRIAPDAKKKEITDDDFGDIIYQNFDEAADIVGWSPPQSPVASTSDSDSGSAGFPDEPPPLLRSNEYPGNPFLGEASDASPDAATRSRTSLSFGRFPDGGAGMPPALPVLPMEALLVDIYDIDDIDDNDDNDDSLADQDNTTAVPAHILNDTALELESDDSFSEQHSALVQEFAREHLSGLPPQETLDKMNEFSKMLSFAMHVASDVVDFYEK